MLPKMLRRDRLRWGLSEMQSARRLQVSVVDYRAIEAGERYPNSDTYTAICELFGWPQAYTSPRGTVYRKCPL